MVNEERNKEQREHEYGPRTYDCIMDEGERVMKSLLREDYLDNVASLRELVNLRADYICSIRSLEPDQVNRAGRMLETLSTIISDQALIAALEK